MENYIGLMFIGIPCVIYILISLTKNGKESQLGVTIVEVRVVSVNE